MSALPGRVRINSMGYTRCAPDWRWSLEPGKLVDYDLWVVLAGQGGVRGPAAEFRIGPASACLFRPGAVHVATHVPEAPLVVVHCHFDFLDPGGRPVYPGEEALPPVPLTMGDLTFGEGLLSRAHQAWQDGAVAGATFWLEAALRELFAHAGRVTAARAVPGEQAVAIEGLCREIRHRPRAAWPVRELASALHCSPDHFTRLFRKLKGCAPREYVLRSRTQAAANLLQASDHSIGRIAELVGYRDVYSFSKQFKARMGMSPTQYRQQGGR